MKGGSTVTSKSIGGSKWGTRDATPGSKFFNFHAVFGKKLQNNRLAHPLFHAVLGKKIAREKESVFTSYLSQSGPALACWR